MTINLTDKDQSIITQVAAKITSELVVASFAHDSDASIEARVQAFAVFLPTINEALFEEITGQVVKSVFPGTTALQDALANVSPVTQAAVPPVGTASQPAAIPGATDGDPAVAALWSLYFADPSQWDDNRASKPSPRHPDFKHKSLKTNDGKYLVSLYLDDKKNPSYVAQRFAA